MIKIKELLIFVFGTLGLGFLSSIFVNNNSYGEFIKPDFSPPSIAFPIAWTILYILMGVSSYIVYMEKDNIKTKEAIYLYAIQLIVNIIWPVLFFTFEFRLFAFLWLILLFVLVVVMSVKFYRIKPIAGLLQIPYILWLIFAGILNYSVYILNR